MADDTKGGLGDDQGTRVGSPGAGKAKPAAHSDSPTGRPDRKTGSGAEATQATDGEAEGHGTEHRGGYGGSGGKPVSPSDKGN